jgi:hypothetical protein
MKTGRILDHLQPSSSGPPDTSGLHVYLKKEEKLSVADECET